MACSIPSSTQGKDNRCVQMTKVVLLYWTNLPCSVKTRPWRIRTNRLPKVLQDLQFLLLAEHHLASGGTLELEDEFGFGAPELLLDLGCHPIEACGDLLLISAREPDARALLDLRLYGDRFVCQAQLRYASNDVLLILHVARGSETERERYSVTQPVLILSEGILWQVLLQYFSGGFTAYLVDDVPLRARHFALATYRDQAVADGPGRSRPAREQSVRDPVGDDLVVTILVGWLPQLEVVAGSPAPDREEPLAREIFFQPRKEVVDVVREPIGEDKQSDGVSRQVGQQVLGYPLSKG